MGALQRSGTPMKKYGRAWSQADPVGDVEHRARADRLVPDVPDPPEGVELLLVDDGREQHLVAHAIAQLGPGREAQEEPVGGDLVAVDDGVKHALEALEIGRAHV